MSNNTISWLGTFLPMLSVADSCAVAPFPMADEVGFYVGENLRVTWTYDADTEEVTRYLTATDDGTDLVVTTWDLSDPDTFSNAYLPMVTLSADLRAWACLP